MNPWTYGLVCAAGGFLLCLFLMTAMIEEKRNLWAARLSGSALVFLLSMTIAGLWASGYQIALFGPADVYQFSIVQLVTSEHQKSVFRVPPKKRFSEY